MKDSNFKLISVAISFAIIIIALSVAYYFVIFLPGKEKFNQEELKKAQQTEKQKQSSEKQIFISCQDEAEYNA